MEIGKLKPIKKAKRNQKESLVGWRPFLNVHMLTRLSNCLMHAFHWRKPFGGVTFGQESEMLLLLALSQFLDRATLLFVDYNPLLDFVSLFSYNTQQNCVVTVKFGKQLYITAVSLVLLTTILYLILNRYLVTTLSKTVWPRSNS